MVGFMEGLIIGLPGLFMLWLIAKVIQRWRKRPVDPNYEPLPHYEPLPPQRSFGYDGSGNVHPWAEEGFTTRSAWETYHRREQEERGS